MLFQIFQPDFEFEDNRGKITQLVREGYRQVNVITSHAGALRGKHYHKLNNEAFFFPYGRCRVTVEDREGHTETKIFGAGEMFRIGPYVMHSFEYLEETMVVSMYDKGVELDGGKMDSYTEFGD
ncbi:MAG: hypothetical protein PUE51_08985 [Veillonellaceae bacterium]|nr:hypothetical protein [Veillonellaceae bacterium]